MCADGSVTEPGADDECPDHPEQQRRGPCGCGFEPDARCAVLESLLAHRYSFSGQGNQVHDSVGGAHGETFNVQLDGSGVLNLNGNGAYAQLPEGVASARNSATFEVWARWDGGDANQRIFNFGTPDDGNGVPESFISLSPTSGADDRLTLSYRVGSSGGQTLRAPTGLPAGSVQHVAVVVDSEQGQLSVYVQGERLVQESTSQQLESLQDRVNWLGRALYPSYPYFRGVLDEFRIYAGALSADEIDMSLELGPSATFSR